MSKATVTPALAAPLKSIVANIGKAFAASTKVAVALGQYAREAAPVIGSDDDQLKAFSVAVKAAAEKGGLTEGSAKVYASHFSGVIKAIRDGHEFADGLSLAEMYKARPGAGASKGTGAGTRHGDGDDAPAGKDAPAAARPATKRDLITALFGHFDDELEAALAHAVAHETMFVAWAKASVAAASSPIATPEPKGRKLRKAA